jgi:hypothetical protein
MVFRAPSRAQSGKLSLCPLHKLIQPPYQREAPIGVTLLYKKQLGVFLQIFNILRKKGEFNFKVDGIG